MEFITTLFKGQAYLKQIITLTTDFGDQDHYAGSMKGVILGINAGVIIVDITHKIQRHDIFKAAFTVRGFYSYFPDDAIHVVVVDPGVGGDRRPIVVETGHGVFVGPDNGVFTLLMDNCDKFNVYEVTNDEYMLNNVSNTFHGRDIFAPVAAHLSSGIEPKELGNPIKAPFKLRIKQPVVSDTEIIGNVIYTDSFGNLITNISSDLVDGYSKVKIGDIIVDTVAKSYQNVAKGELIAIIGSSGFLEIAVNQGSAADIIKDDEIRVIK